METADVGGHSQLNVIKVVIPSRIGEDDEAAADAPKLYAP
jgi:hypothetical protein